MGVFWNVPALSVGVWITVWSLLPVYAQDILKNLDRIVFAVQPVMLYVHPVMFMFVKTMVLFLLTVALSVGTLLLSHPDKC